MNLPSSLWSFSPFTVHIPIIGSVVAIIITKQLFGGLGYNIFNPALIGRAFFVDILSKGNDDMEHACSGFFGLDAKTSATPLGILKEEGAQKLIEAFGDTTNLYSQLLLGHRAGSIGETSAIALLLGAGFLYVQEIYNLAYTNIIPCICRPARMGLSAARTCRPERCFFHGDPAVHLLSGGILLGAFFMATDYVTCPSVRRGQIVFGIGCGALTMLIRLKGGYPEGVMFAILYETVLPRLLTGICGRGFSVL